MFLALLIVGGFLSVLGTLIFIVDAFKVHWGWGLSVLFIPFAQLVCLIKHWAETKRGFLLTLLAIPFLAGAAFTMPKAGAKDDKGKPLKINDPFFNAMQHARNAVAKTQESRKEETVGPTIAPSSSTPASTTPEVVPKPAPVLALEQRLTKNRAAFKNLENQFAALDAKRKALPKNNSQAIAAFNLEAKAYAEALAEARSEQAILLELQRTAPSK